MTTATSYVRKATAAGALIAPFDSLFVRAALAVMEQTRVERCPHLDGELTTGVAIWPLDGPGVETLLCLDCWGDPGPTDGCLACDRRPAPGLRKILSPPLPLPNEQVVIVGYLCSFDRRPLA